jgi:hypothetical protein
MRATRPQAMLEHGYPMLTLARSGFGRVFLHLVAMLCDGAVRVHAAGIARELQAWPRR